MHLKNIFNWKGNPPLPKCCSSNWGPASVSRDSLAELARNAQVPGEDSAILMTSTGDHRRRTGFLGPQDEEHM